jgi:phosphopantothenoylcysteine decarboxylase / phosphopantothenate---cysteine ligase
VPNLPKLTGQKIVVGVTGGIAAYKSCELVRRLIDSGAEVRVVLTSGAEAFVTPLTFQALSGNPVSTKLLDEKAEAGMGHIELARWADRVIVAPATANFISRLACGNADDLLSTLCLATKATIAVAPSMNQGMWLNPATQNNINLLELRDIEIIGPAAGDQACGDTGPGRMSEPAEIIEALSEDKNSRSLQNKKVVITAGPTQEALDPVRYLSNYSSGKMGYALAMACAKAGAETILVSGPVSLACPNSVSRISVTSCEQMQTEVMSNIEGADIFIGAAAVADYRAESIATQKIKKRTDSIEIKLIKNPDILAVVASLKKRPFVVGFAAESENLIENATKKLESKNLDLIVANDISGTAIGFQSEENAVTLLGSGNPIKIGRAPKRLIAKQIVEFISAKI